MVPGATILLFFPSAGGSGSAPASTLAEWQVMLFGNLCDLWEPSRTEDADGDTQPVAYTQRYTGVPWYLVADPNYPDRTGGGRFMMHTVLVEDVGWFADGQQIEVGWVVVNKSLNPDGSQSRNYGVGWMAQGTSRRQISTLLDEGHREVVMETLPALPANVTT